MWHHGLGNGPHQAPLSIKSSDKNTRVGCHSLQVIFPIQGSNPGLLHSQRFFTVWDIRETLYTINTGAETPLTNGTRSWRLQYYTVPVMTVVLNPKHITFKFNPDPFNKWPPMWYNPKDWPRSVLHQNCLCHQLKIFIFALKYINYSLKSYFL